MFHFYTRFILLVSLAIIAIGPAQAQEIPDQRPPKDFPPVAQLTYAQGGEIDLMSFYTDWPLTIARLTEDFDYPAFSPAWTNDGLGLAFVGEKNGQSDVYLWQGDVSYVYTDSPEKEQLLAWSPDRTKISFIQTRGQLTEPELAVLDLNTAEVLVVAESVAMCCHIWVNNETLAYISLETEENHQVSIAAPDIRLGYERDLQTNIPPRFAMYGLPEIANSVLVEAGKSPDGQFVYAIVDTVNAETLKTTTALFVFGPDDEILAEIQNVQAGDVQWRPMPEAMG